MEIVETIDIYFEKQKHNQKTVTSIDRERDLTAERTLTNNLDFLKVFFSAGTLFFNKNIASTGRDWICLFFCQFYVESILLNIILVYSVWHLYFECNWCLDGVNWLIFCSPQAHIKVWYYVHNIRLVQFLLSFC